MGPVTTADPPTARPGARFERSPCSQTGTLARVLAVLVTGLTCAACATWSLRQSVIRGDLAATRKMEQTQMSPESPDDCGWTLLHYASYYQHAPIVEYLIGRRVNVNAITTQHSARCTGYSHIPAGSTPLIIAAYYGQADIVELLLAHRADPSPRNAEGYDALMYARKFEFVETARLLESVYPR